MMRALEREREREKERERERERERNREIVVYNMCVCDREREREKGGGEGGERERRLCFFMVKNQCAQRKRRAGKIKADITGFYLSGQNARVRRSWKSKMHVRYTL